MKATKNDSKAPPAGQLFFLEVDTPGSRATNNKARSTINSHIAKHTQERKRQAKQQWKRSNNVALAIRKAEVKTTEIINQPTRDASSSSSSSSSEGSEASTSPTTTPVMYQYKGNSDPFNSAAIHIGPRANQYIQFGQEYVIPSIYGTGPRGWTQSINTARSWQNVSQDLMDRGSAAGVLAFYATCLARIAGDSTAAVNALTYKNVCSEALRSALDQGQSNSRYQGLIFRLLRAEILAQNWEAAKVHAAMLKSLSEEAALRNELDLSLLTVILWQHNSLYTSILERPIFDFEWIEEVFHECWQELRETSPLELATDYIYDGIFDQRLQSIFSDCRQFLLISEAMVQQRYIANAGNWFWLVARCEWLQVRLLSYYADIVESQGQLHGRFLHVQSVRACLMLSALFTIRHQKNRPQIRGIQLYRSASALYQALSALLSSLDPSLLVEYGPSSDILFWLYYVAAIAEWEHGPTDHLSGSRTLCRMMLRDHALGCGITTWSEARAVLTKFVYTDLDLPCPGSAWYNALLSAVRIQEIP